MFVYDESKWFDHFVKFEGKANHFYLDGEGIVTVGVGCVVWEPTQLPMLRYADARPASVEEIKADYLAVKAMTKNQSLNAYRRVCRTYLPEKDIKALFKSRLDKFIKEVEPIFSLSTYPEDARLVIVDMAFNLGTSGLTRKFPKFVNAFKAKDFFTASLECRRNGIQPSRNEWTRETLERLSVTTRTNVAKEKPSKETK